MKQLKKKRSDGGKSGKSAGSDPSPALPNDTHHNAATPCSNAAAAVASEIFPTVVLSPAEAGGGENDGGKSAGSGKKQNESPAITQQEGQPLLGYMIQRHLVEERRKARTPAKKKKSKKKKKKKSGAASAATPAGDQQAATPGDQQQEGTACENGGDGDSGDCQSPPAASDDKGESNDSVVKRLQPSELISISPGPSENPPSPPNGGPKVPDTPSAESMSELDRILDSLIDCKDAGSAHGAGPRGDRNLDAFAAYLVGRLETHMDEQRNQHFKSKASSSIEDLLGEGPLEYGGAGFKDVLPTISVKEVHDHCSIAIDCKKCQWKAMAHLKKLLPGVPPDLFGWEGAKVNWERSLTSGPAVVLDAETARATTPPPPAAKEAKANGGKHAPLAPIASRFLPCDFLSGIDPLDSAFDYVSMDDIDLEAGGGGPEAKGGDPKVDKETPKRDNGVATAPTFSMELRPVAGLLQMGTISMGEDYPVSARDIVDLVKHVLLPCGLGKGGDDHVEAEALGEKERADIVGRYMEHMKAHNKQVLGMREALNRLRGTWEKTVQSNNRSCFDVSTNKFLYETDDACEDLLKEVGTFLFELSKRAYVVAWANDYGSSILRFINQQWNEYHQLLCELVGPSLKWQGHRVQCATDPRGKGVPVSAMSAQVRVYQVQYIESKVAVLESFMEKFFQSIKWYDPQLQRAHPIVQMTVLGAYLWKVDGEFYSRCKPDFEGMKLLQELLVAQIKFSQSVPRNASVDNMKKHAQERRDEVVSLFKKGRRIVIAIDDFAPKTKIEFLSRAWDDLDNTWFGVNRRAEEHSKSNKAIQGLMQYEITDSCLLLQKCTILLQQWLVLTTHRHCCESPLAPLVLPRNVDAWMLSCARNKPREGISADTCGGHGGERRVTSIVAALLYRWLEARCSEWNAELTRDEFLLSMDLEEPMAVAPREGGTKGGKKKKKSKRKAAGNRGKDAEESSDAKDAATQESSSGTGEGEKKPAVDEGEKEATPIAVVQEELKVESTKDRTVDQAETAETDNTANAESLTTTEEGIGIEVSPEEIEATAALEEEWKQKKSSEEGEWVQTTSKRRGAGNKGGNKEERGRSQAANVDKRRSKKSEAGKRQDSKATERPPAAVNAGTKGGAVAEAGKQQESKSAERPPAASDAGKKGGAAAKAGMRQDSKPADRPTAAVNGEKKGRAVGAASSPPKQVPAKEDIGKPGGSSIEAGKKEKKTAAPIKGAEKSASGKAVPEPPQKNASPTKRAEKPPPSKPLIELPEYEPASEETKEEDSDDDESVAQQRDTPKDAPAKQTMKEGPRPGVGVVDGTNFVSAEAFLVDRLRAFLPTSKVVWM
ncbi:hypothetical protein ACHAXT_012475 [Thalassiosira profunda]